MFGFQQSALWDWGSPAIWASIAVGVILLVVFFNVELRTESPLINVRIFENRTFLVENVILGIAMMAFIPVFFFASIYGQVALAAAAQAAKIAQLQGGNGNVTAIPPFIRADFAAATREVLFGMCLVMAVAGLVALRGLRRGVQQEADETAGELAGEDPGTDLYQASL